MSQRPNPLIGFLMLIPAGIACITNLLLPTGSIFIQSLQDSRPFSDDSTFVGAENYQQLFENPMTQEVIQLTLLVTVFCVLLIALVPPLFALGAHETGRIGRVTSRILVSIPLAFYSPVAFALVVQLNLEQRVLRDILSEAPQVFVGGLIAWQFVAVGGALAISAYLMAAKASEVEASLSKIAAPLITVWVISILSAIALVLQAYTVPNLLTGGAFGTSLFAEYAVSRGLIQFRFGQWGAISIFQLAPLMLMGLITVAIIVATNLAITIKHDHAPIFPSKAVGIGLLVMTVPAVLGGLLLWSMAGVIAALGGGSPSLAEAFTPLTFVNTILPPIARLLLLQLPLLILTALAIGALRPLGRWSEALLLLFAPWLYVAGHTLAAGYVPRFTTLGLLGSPVTLLPPMAISIPMLVILTLFYKGRVPAWQQSGTFMKTVFVPSLPLLGLFCVGMVVYSSQNYSWQFMVAIGDLATVPITASRVFLTAAFDTGAVSAAIRRLTVLQGVLTFALLVVGHLFVLERLALTQVASDMEPATGEEVEA